MASVSRYVGPVMVIIPARNEAANLEPVLTSISSLKLPLDVVVVDDRSNDQTAQVARRLGARVLQLSSNLGYGGAVQAGFR